MMNKKLDQSCYKEQRRIKTALDAERLYEKGDSASKGLQRASSGFLAGRRSTENITLVAERGVFHLASPIKKHRNGLGVSYIWLEFRSKMFRSKRFFGEKIVIHAGNGMVDEVQVMKGIYSSNCSHCDEEVGDNVPENKGRICRLFNVNCFVMNNSLI